MFKEDALEAAPIVDRAMLRLLAAAPTRGRAGSDLRSACGYVRANAMPLLYNNEIGPPMARCFDLALQAAISQKQVSYVRTNAEAETAVSVGAVLVKNAIIRMCLVTESRVISGMTFKSRDEVEALKATMNSAFDAAEEIAADEMAQSSYQALIALHAAVAFYLIETARPLPRMLRFEFAEPMPTLLMAHRLYYDASRADELREENKVVHPAFMLPTGRALGA